MVFRIDSREALMHPITTAHLQRCSPMDEIEITQLTFGDYAFEGKYPLPGNETPPTIGVEVSTVNDLVSKIHSGRYGYQLTGLVQSYDVPILLISGQLRADSVGKVLMNGPSQVNYDQINAALFSAQCHGVIVRFTRTADQDVVAGELWQMWRYWQKPYDAHDTFRELTVVRKPVAKMPLGVPLDARIQTLMTLPDVGEKGATAALQVYPSLFQFFVAQEDDRLRILGWGRKTTRAVHEFIWRGFHP